MDQALLSFIDNKIEEATTFVCKHLPVNLPDNDIYEGLVGEPHVLEAFRNAGRYLPPTNLNKHITLKLGDETLSVQVRLGPTEKYPVFLMPKYDLTITRESDLGQAMALARKVAGEWDTLVYVWERFRFNVPDPHALGFVFPWLREMFLDFDLHNLPVIPHRRSQREDILREAAKIVQRTTPNHFPRLSPDLNVVCQSGKRLFGQYRMLESAASQTELTKAPLVISRGPDKLVPQWVREHTDEALIDWQEEREAIERAKKRAKFAKRRH